MRMKRERDIYKIRVEEVEFLNRLLCSKSLVLEREEFFEERKILNWENKYKGGKENEILVLGGNLI